MKVPNANQQFEQLVRQIAPASRLVRTWDLKGGISAEMTALEIAYPNGQISKMIARRPGEGALKQNPHAAETEFKLLQIARSLGLATQTPYQLDQTGAIFPAPFLVIEYIEGRPEFAPVHGADFTRQAAAQLAKIHSADCADLDLTFLPKQTFANALGERPANVDESLAEGHIRATLEAAGRLAQTNAAALLHGDFWPGNLLWHGGKLVAVIDWENAAVGDPLADLAISRLDWGWIFGIDAMHSFTEHYQSIMALDYANLPYWDLYAALRLARLAGADLAEWAAFFAPFGRHDITAQTIREDYWFFITQAFEKLAAA